VSSSAPGTANERTSLAWQRTTLSLIGAAAVVVRMTWTDLGYAALIGPAVIVALSAWVFVENRKRYRRRAGGAHSPAYPLAVTLAVAAMALTELAALWTRG